MRTIDKINAISQELFKCNFIFLDKPDQDEVFARYLVKYATDVQPKSRNYNRYTKLKK